MKANDLTCLDYKQDGGLLTLELTCTLDEALALTPAQIAIKTDAGDAVETFTGFAIRSATVDAEDKSHITLNLYHDVDGAGAGVDVLGKRIDGLETTMEAVRATADAASAKADQVEQSANPQIIAFAKLSAPSMAASLTDAQVASISTLWPGWSGDGVAYKVKDVVQYQGELYRCSQAHTSQTDWSPTAYAAGWAHIGIAPDGLLIWTADAIKSDPNIYNTGVKVHYPDAAGKVYVSKRDGNTSTPGADEWWTLWTE